MEESAERRKIIELEHLLHQNKIYQLTYQGKPLRPKKALTYLEFTKFITQLAPTIQSHYLDELSHDQNNTITDVISNLFADILQKLKGLANLLERKESPQEMNHDTIDICRVCQHQLRKAQVSNVKQSLRENQGLTQDILNMIKQIENESDPFAFDQDNIFFKELRIALQKKQQVLNMCNTQSQNYIKQIENQLGELIKAKEVFSNEQNGRQLEGDVKKGSDLKQSVISSLKVNIKERLPVMVDQIMKILLISQQRERKLKRKEIQVQTIEYQNPKINQMKKKIAEMTEFNNQIVSEKQKIQEQLQKKKALILKLQKQLNDLQSQFAIKVVEFQRDITDLETSKNKEEDMLKSRLDLLSRETSEKMKSIKSFNKMKNMVEQSVLYQAAATLMTPILPNEESETSEILAKNKKILNSSLKGSSKIVFPTLTRIRIMDQAQLIHNSNRQKQESKIIIVDEAKKGENEPNHSMILPTLQDQVLKTTGMSRSLVKNKQIRKQKTSAEQIQFYPNDVVNQSLQAPQIQINLNRKTERRLVQVKERYVQEARFTNKESNYKEKDQTNNIRVARKLNDIQKIGKKYNNTNKKQSQQQSLAKIKKQKSLESEQMMKEGVRQSVSSQKSLKRIQKSISKQKKEIKQINIKRQLISKQDVVIKPTNQKVKQKLPTFKRQILRNDFQKNNEELNKQNTITPAKREFQRNSCANFSSLEKTSIQQEIQKIYDLLQQQGTLTEITKNQFKNVFMICLDDMTKKTYQSNVSSPQGKKDNFDYNHHLESCAIINAQTIQKEKMLTKERHMREMKILKNKLQSHTEVQQNQNVCISAYVSRDLSYESLGKSKSIKQENVKMITEPQQSKTSFIDDNILFGNEEMAYRYQISFSKKALKMPILTSQLRTFAKNLFERLQELKYFSNTSYQQICSFLRYPFSNSKKGSLQIDIIQNISSIALTQCFQRIAGFHKKCQNEGGLCIHLMNFYKQVEDMVHKFQ